MTVWTQETHPPSEAATALRVPPGRGRPAPGVGAPPTPGARCGERAAGPERPAPLAAAPASDDVAYSLPPTTLNTSRADRTVRLLAVIVVLGLFATDGVLDWMLVLVAIVLAGTAFVGTCPLYLPFGLSTQRRAA